MAPASGTRTFPGSSYIERSASQPAVRTGRAPPPDLIRKKDFPKQRATGLRIGELQRLERDCLLRSQDGNCTLRVPIPDRGAQPATNVVAALDDLIARTQQLRFDHPDERRRHDLQRLVERLRRARADLEATLGAQK